MALAHIAGNPETLTPLQSDLLEQVAMLGRERIAPRAARHDREATFPHESFADLRAAGLLGLCVPRAHGGLGADFATYALVGAELGRHCASTALTFALHASACLWSGAVADTLELSPAERADHERCRARQADQVVRLGQVYGHPYSEEGAAAAGKAPWSTRARRVDGGYVVDGRKIFTSLAGAADHYAVLCTLERPAATQRDALLLAVPAVAPGVSVAGDWDTLGMRGTVSRTLVLDGVFVPDAARLLPEGAFFQAAARWPHMCTALAPAYFGIAQATYDFTVAFLRGEAGVAPAPRRMYPTKQQAVAEMRLRLEQTRALFLAGVQEARPDPDADALARLLAAHYTVMENANDICRLAVRTCGGQAMLKSLPLERLYRDSRCGSVMLPWTAELCLDRLGRGCLYEDGERDEAIDP